MLSWIGIDWGTSNLRAWAFDAQDNPQGEFTSPDGMGSMTPSDYPQKLDEILQNLSKFGEFEPSPDVLICGMAGAKQGWKEATYLNLPLPLDQIVKSRTKVDTASPSSRVCILPGVAQTIAGQNDVMRGEETQLLGLLESHPSFSGTVAMPGTHSKWAKIENGELIRFQTVMTGELFDVLCKHSVLRHSMPTQSSSDSDEDGLNEGLETGFTHPEKLQSFLFKTRASMLVSGKSAEWARSFLSGLLIGTEVKTNAPSTPQNVPIVGSARLSPIYAKALEKLGHTPLQIDATKVTIAGLVRAHRAWAEEN